MKGVKLNGEVPGCKRISPVGQNYITEQRWLLNEQITATLLIKNLGKQFEATARILILGDNITM